MPGPNELLLQLQDRFAGIAHTVLNQVEETPDLTGGVGETYLGLWRGIAGSVCAMATLDLAAPPSLAIQSVVGRFLICVKRLTEFDENPLFLGMLGGRVGLLLCAAELTNYFGLSAHREWLRAYVPHFAETVSRHDDLRPDFGSGYAGLLCGLVWISGMLDLRLDDAIRRLSQRCLDKLVLAPQGRWSRIIVGTVLWEGRVASPTVRVG